MNHDKHPDESKTRTHRLSKLPDDGDPWAPNNLLTPEQKKNTSWTPVGQATDKKLRPQPTKMNSFMSELDVFKALIEWPFIKLSAYKVPKILLVNKNIFPI